MWWWRIRYPKDFYRCLNGFWWIKEECTEDKGRFFFAIAKSFQNYHPSARQYLELCRQKHDWSTLWLQYGREYQAPSLKDAINLIEDNLMQEPTLCFANSLEMGELIRADYPELEVKYAEGLALDITGVYPHAWLVINGKVVDLTWSTSFTGAYFGVEFELDDARASLQKTSYYGFICNWKNTKNFVQEMLASR